MKVKICDNHLASLYEALKSANVSQVKKIEHQLTHEEECVACVYLLKSSGNAKQALAFFLRKEGFPVKLSDTSGKFHWHTYLLTRVLLFAVLFAAIFSIIAVVSGIIIDHSFIPQSVRLFPLLISFLLSVLVFLVIDDSFFE